jgi:hypothetical protein
MSRRNLKKQSQFAGRQHECKLFYNKELQRFCSSIAAEKQSRKKAHPRLLAGNAKRRECMPNDRVRFEKTKPISGWPSECKRFTEKGLWK